MHSVLRVAVVAMVLTVATEAAAVLRKVPSEYPTIQLGVDAAIAGDTVLVAPGIYAGPGNHDIDLHGKAIVLRSSGGMAVTTIDCGGSSGTVRRGFYLHSGESVTTVIEGFTVRNALAPGPYPGDYGAGERGRRYGTRPRYRHDRRARLDRPAEIAA